MFDNFYISSCYHDINSIYDDNSVCSQDCFFNSDPGNDSLMSVCVFDVSECLYDDEPID